MLKFLPLLGLGLVPTALGLTNPSSYKNKCAKTCHALETFMPDGQVSKPHQDGYRNSMGSYWSAGQQEVRPDCVVLPICEDDVAKAVFLITGSVGGGGDEDEDEEEDEDEQEEGGEGDCKFAVRGGGHSSVVGASNAPGGVTIDLQALDQISLSEHGGSSVRVGGGARWGDLYPVLDEAGKSTLGGKLGMVGIPGLTTGGGLSYFMPRYGFVCNAVLNFRVVLFNGTVVNANSETNPRLWRALKGGGQANFGIITEFEFFTWDQGNDYLLWDSNLIHPQEALPQVFEAVQTYTNSSLGFSDLDCNYINALSTTDYGKSWRVTSSMDNVKGIRNPDSFQPFYNLPILANSTSFNNISALAEGQPLGPEGYRWLSGTGTYGNSAEMMSRFFRLWNETLHHHQDFPAAADDGFTFQIVYQLLNQHMIDQGEVHGGDSLGLGGDGVEKKGDNHIYTVTLRWSDPENDEVVNEMARSTFARTDREAKDLGIFQPFRYLNYAGGWQEPIESYGEPVVEELWEVSKMYDPRGVFQYKVPGGFKLPKRGSK